MFIAQQLYEGVQLGEKGLTGLASYIRTDLCQNKYRFSGFYTRVY